MRGFKYLLLFFIGAGGALLILFLYTNKDASPKIFSLTSPLPDALSNIFPSVLGAANYWYPSITPVSENNPPNLTAVAALSYDVTGSQMLFSYNESKRIPMASLTKIMTAILALENDNLTSIYTVSSDAAGVGENAMGLTAGEQLTLKDLLYGMMLPSGNDAAEVIAEGSKFGRSGFIYQMNKKAESLGLNNTHFTNPSGLEGDGDQYSTAVDLLILSRYAMKNPNFAKIVGTYEYEIPATLTNKYFLLRNDTNLLTSYPGVKGIKTGFTWEAGMCLVTYYESDGITVISVLLNSQDRRGEMKTLLDYSIRKLGKTPPQHS